MQGWKIFSHSMGMVTRNLGTAIRIALVPALIGVALMTATFMMTGLSMETMSDEYAMERMIVEEGAATFFVPLLLFVVILLVIEFWVFVAWHRFILLEEYPAGWIPKFMPDRILAYFGKVLILGLIGIGIGVVVTLAVTALGAMAGEAGAVIAVPAMIALWLYLVVIVYRLTPILPAAAIGTPLKVSEAWEATRGTGWAIVLVIIITFVVQFLLQLVAGFSLAIFAPLGFVFLLLTMLVMTLVNVSILTTLYGHYIEGRSLD